MTFEILNKARALIEQYRLIDKNNFFITSINVYNSPETVIKTFIKPPMDIEIQARVYVPVGKMNQIMTLTYNLTENDLSDTSDINKVIGNINNFDSDTKEALRLAYILLDGYKRLTKGVQDSSVMSRVSRVDITRELM